MKTKREKKTVRDPKMIQMLELADKHLKIIIYLVLKNKQEMKN